MRTTPRPIAALLDARGFGILARGVLTLPYWSSGFAKLTDLDGAFAEAAHFGLEPAGLVVAATIFVQVGASVLLILGRFGWLAAGALGVFTAMATMIGHPFWEIADPVARFHDRNSFLEHVGLIGGFMLAAILTEREVAR
ncbi:DoxX family protein [Sphingomonas crocodyli]|uniref:DoxX family protein n=1 Tax=Sphingomonas crocodyli TaxID=1979270 RepID=A0A437M0Q7_9SPHN|nr:DoxX family protein [Sphingomonas crocodyli]RVT91192.1 DoxX family protein [Sphingomonas crocodyli]